LPHIHCLLPKSDEIQYHVICVFHSAKMITFLKICFWDCPLLQYEAQSQSGWLDPELQSWSILEWLLVLLLQHQPIN
jgi:hypothetical protein